MRKKIESTKDWKGGTQNVMATLNASNHSEFDREENDYYATPEIAVKELLRLEKFDNNIWECACGEGHISKILSDEWYIVYSSDLIDRGFGDVKDFLSSEVTEWKGDIITNPPYAKATEFLIKCLEIIPEGNKVAFFLRVQFLEGVKRRKIFEKNPPRRVLVASRNLRCAKNGDFDSATGNASTYCWFIWEKGFKGKPEIGWFN